MHILLCKICVITKVTRNLCGVSKNVSRHNAVQIFNMMNISIEFCYELICNDNDVHSEKFAGSINILSYTIHNPNLL